MPKIDNNTLLLLHGNDFEDSSEMKKTVTSHGVLSGNEETHFPGQKSFYFNGNSYIAVNPSDFGSDDFTIDWWENAESGAGTRFYTTYGQAYGGVLLGHAGNEAFLSSTLNSWNIFSGVSAFDVTPGKWVHWAFVKHGDVWRTYKNGKMFWEGWSYLRPAGTLDYEWSIGQYYKEGGNAFKGYIQELQVSNVARWTEDFVPPDEPYKGPYDIKIDIPVPNGFLYFVRQYPLGVNGVYQRELPKSTVSGMPVGYIIASEIPTGSKIAMTDPQKLSDGEIGYIVIQHVSDLLYIVPDAHRITSTWSNRTASAQQFISDMTEKAKQICTLVSGAMTTTQLQGGIPYFPSGTGACAERAFWNTYWTGTAVDSSRAIVVGSDGHIGTDYRNISNPFAIRPLFSIPASTLVSAQPNASGAYELV